MIPLCNRLNWMAHIGNKFSGANNFALSRSVQAMIVEWKAKVRTIVEMLISDGFGGIFLPANLVWEALELSYARTTFCTLISFYL